MPAIDQVQSLASELASRLKALVDSHRAAEADFVAIQRSVEDLKTIRENLARKVEVEKAALMRAAQEEADAVLKKAIEDGNAVLATAAAKAKRIEADIERLQQVLGSLEVQRADRQKYVDALNQAIANSPQLRHK